MQNLDPAEESFRQLQKTFQNLNFQFSDLQNNDIEKYTSEKNQALFELIDKRRKEAISKKDPEFSNWKDLKSHALNQIYQEVGMIYNVSEWIKAYLNRSKLPAPRMKPTQINRRSREVDEIAIEKRYIKARKEILLESKKKVSKALEKFEKNKIRSKKFLKILEEDKIEFDYENNSNILKLDYKQINITTNSKIVLFFTVPKNFPDASYYRSLVTIDTQPKDEIEYDLSKLKKKMDDLFEKNLNISLTYKKDKQKKSLITFQLRKVKKKSKEIEFKLLNIQLFNYLLQILEFGKALPADFPHTKSYLDIDCGNNMTLELIYKENKDKESKDTNSDFVLYIMLLWAVNESPTKQVKHNISETYGFLGIYVRIKKKLNKLKATIPGFFYTEEFNPHKLEVYFEAFLGYSQTSSFMIFKRYGPQVKRKFFLIRGNKLYLVHNLLGFTSEVSVETFLKEDIKEYFYLSAKSTA